MFKVWLKWVDRLGPLVMLLALILGFALSPGSDYFMTWSNWHLILMNTAIVAVCACGMTVIMISGGLDLAVGSTVALSAVSGGLVLEAGGGGFLAMLVAILVGAFIGLINGGIIAGLRLSPFIVTLGMMGVARGVARLLADDGVVYFEDEAAAPWISDMLSRNLSAEPWASIGIAPGIVALVATAILTWLLLSRTVFGRHCYAIGANEEAARLCGVPVGWRVLLCYVIAGCCFGVAGMMQFSFESGGNSTGLIGLELQVIAAVVIGGASLTGGVGTIWGSLVGALVMVVLTNGCVLNGIEEAVQMIVVGTVIIGAVCVDQLRQGKLPLPNWLRR